MSARVESITAARRLTALASRQLELQRELEAAKRKAGKALKDRDNARIAGDDLDSLREAARNALVAEEELRDACARIAEQIGETRKAVEREELLALNSQANGAIDGIQKIASAWESAARELGKQTDLLLPAMDKLMQLIGSHVTDEFSSALRRVPQALECYLAIHVNRPGERERLGSALREFLRIPTPTHDHGREWLATQTAAHQLKRLRELIAAPVPGPDPEPTLPEAA